MVPPGVTRPLHYGTEKLGGDAHSIIIMRDGQGSVMILDSKWHITSKDVVSCCVDRNGILLVPQGTTHFLHITPCLSLLTILLLNTMKHIVASKLHNSKHVPTTQLNFNIS